MKTPNKLDSLSLSEVGVEDRHRIDRPVKRVVVLGHQFVPAALDQRNALAARDLGHALHTQPAGDFDGRTLTYDSAVPGALYDPMPWPQPTSAAAEEHSQAELDAIARELNELPGALSTTPGDNLVVVDVVHDDGSFQEWADATYGDGLVFVHSALIAAG